MKRYTDKVIICYDADEAGQKATTRAIPILRDAGVDIRIINIPDGKDPDEFIRLRGDKGAAAFRNILENCNNDVEYRLLKLKKRFDVNRPDSKVTYMAEALKIIASLDSSVEQDIYISKLSAEFGIEKASIIEDLRKLNKQKQYYYEKKEVTKLTEELRGNVDNINTEKAGHTRAAKAEEMLIAYLLNHNDHCDYVRSRIAPSDFVTNFNADVYSYILDRISSGVSPAVTFTRDFTGNEASKIYEILSSYNSQAATRDAMQEYINTILEEKNRLTPEKLTEMTPEEIQASLYKKKKN